MIPVSQFVTDLTDKRLIPAVVDNVYNGNVLTMRLMGKARPWRGGTKISQPVYLSPVTTVGSYSGFDPFNTTQETKTQRAEFDPSQVYASVQVSGIQLAINQSGDVGAIDLITSELDITAEALKQEIGTELYTDGTGNSSKDILGLVAAVDDSTNVRKMAFDKLSQMLEQLVRSFVLTPQMA